MAKLTGIKAFEARWQALRSSYGSNTADAQVLMQTMGRLVDNYATHEELLQELPTRLSAMFECLVDAYLNGYWVEDESPQKPPSASSVSRTLSPAMLAAIQRRQQRQAQPTDSSEAPTYIVRDSGDFSGDFSASYSGNFSGNYSGNFSRTRAVLS
jgi:hypothetical protein